MSRTFRLGVFIVGTLLVAAIGVFLIGRKQFLFSSTYSLRTEFQNVAGLNDAAEVRVGGVHKGTVTQIVLPTRPDAKVTVLMEMERASREVIKKDSLAAIKTEGLVGNKYVEISFGSKDAERVKDGETIGSEPPVEIGDLVKKSNQILDGTKDMMQDIQATTRDLQSISSKIDQGAGTAGALVNDRTLYTRANAATAEAKAGATAFRENMEALKNNFFLRGFFRRRGYEDSSELKKYAIAQLPTEPYSRKFVYDAKQIFDKPETAKLKNQKALNEAGKFLEQDSFGLAVIASYSGMKGDSEKQRVLTEARSVVIREYLADNFRLDDSRIKTIGFGKTNEAENSGKVEVIVYPVAPSATVARKQSARSP